MKPRLFVTGVILTVVLVGGVLWMRQGGPLSNAGKPAAGTKSKGPENAPVEIVAYSDFQCPACKVGEPLVAALMEQYPGKVRYAFRHFPLPGHQWSAIAHQAAECANQRGLFWEYHDRLYAEQVIWSAMEDPTATFLVYAKELKIPVNDFAVCLADTAVRDKITKEKQAGTELQINSTPTFFVNGQRLVGGRELKERAPAMINQILGIKTQEAPAPASTPAS